jgi:MFS family permease
VLLTAVVAFGLAHSAFFLLPKFLELELHADPSQIGLYVAVTWFANVALVPFVGLWVDERGRLPLAVAGAAGLAATCGGFLALSGLGPYLLALRVAHGFAFTAFFVATSTLAADLAPPENLGQVLGYYGSGWVFTNAAAPAVGEWLADRAGWPWVFGAATALALLSLVLLALVREHRHPPLAEDMTVPGLGAVLERPRFARVCAISALAGVTFAAMFTFHQPFALSLGIHRVSDFFVAYSAAAVVVRGPFGGWADRAGRMRVAGIALVTYGLSALAMTELESLGLVCTGAVFGVAHGLFYPSLSAAAIEGAPSNLRGKLTALFNGAFNAGFSLGSFALGYAAARFGYPAVFGLACVCSVAALGLLFGRAPEEDTG